MKDWENQMTQAAVADELLVGKDNKTAQPRPISLKCRLGLHAWAEWSEPYYGLLVPRRQSRSCILCNVIVERDL